MSDTRTIGEVVEWLRAEAFRYNEVNGEIELALLRAADILERAVPSDAYQRVSRDGMLEEYDNQQALLAQRGRKP